ncbi:unannotated protein [freshwater metagenome]|uniref:Unannotated protein n=1 Tax=freshwater metagenome TaxID=449393 RepID=A0A6J5ZL82_9ZZZZ
MSRACTSTGVENVDPELTDDGTSTTSSEATSPPYKVMLPALTPIVPPLALVENVGESAWFPICVTWNLSAEKVATPPTACTVLTLSTVNSPSGELSETETFPVNPVTKLSYPSRASTVTVSMVTLLKTAFGPEVMVR